jgi:hypothetical protein
VWVWLLTDEMATDLVAEIQKIRKKKGPLERAFLSGRI